MTRRQAVGAWAIAYKNYSWASGFAAPVQPRDPFDAVGRELPPNTWYHIYDGATGAEVARGRLT